MHTNSGRSLAVRVGALAAALSLMLAGGAAMASSASAAVNADKGGNGNGNGVNGGQGNTGQGQGGGVGNNNNNGGAIHGDNGPNQNPNNGNQLGGNGSNLTGGTGHVAVKICHATRSNSNPYVLVVSDFSSVDEALLWLQGKSNPQGKATGNGHGDHVGTIFNGEKSGTNWGDIISEVWGKDADGNKKMYYPGYNLGAISAALGGKSGADILAADCNVPPTDSSFPACVTLTSADPAAYSKLVFTGEVGTPESTWLSPAGKPFSDYTVSSNAGSTDSTVGCGTPCDPNTETCTPPCDPNTQTCTEGAEFFSGIKLCEVVDGAYTGIGSVPGKGKTQRAADDDAVNNANAKSTGDNIIPPVEFASGARFAGYNWNEKTQARFNSGNCSEVLSVISATPLPGTVAPAAGKPAPAKTPTSATLPGSVPAGDGSSAPVLPLWALAMVIVGALGAAAAGSQLLGNRK